MVNNCIRQPAGNCGGIASKVVGTLGDTHIKKI